MDRGHVDYKRFYDIELAKSFFVTRMKTNCRYEVEKKLFDSTTGAIRYDGIIRLTSTKGLENYPGIIRKIRYHDDEYDRDYVFITNNF